MSTKVNGETRERHGQSAKRSASVRGQAGRGATVAGRRLPGAAEQNVGIFGLPGFVADRGQICFSRGSLLCFLLHVRDRGSGFSHRNNNRSPIFSTGQEGRVGASSSNMAASKIAVFWNHPAGPKTSEPLLSYMALCTSVPRRGVALSFCVVLCCLEFYWRVFDAFGLRFWRKPQLLWLFLLCSFLGP